MPPVCPHVVYLLIVDAEPSGYTRLAEAAEGMGITILHATTARAALGLARWCHPQLCMVNSQLSDASGFELLGSFRGELPEATFFLVGDRYREEDEFRALTTGSTIYVCKPVQAAWITACTLRENAQPSCSFKSGWPGVMDRIVADHTSADLR
jgi:DNA-binding response OmpR family regulator